MIRIAGVNLPENKRIEIGLTYIYGIGNSLSKKILATANIDVNVKAKDLKDSEANLLREIIEKNHQVEGDLRRNISENVKRLKEIGSYRGERHKKGLPSRGQRTKTNARTKRGRKVTVGSGKKPSAQKT
ncbi:30S ribosomal protein S13 [bacterium CG_4_10_14_0_2_um_filter_33_32]|nr:MAG: 30S ribosomal protein S13 [bacterium CG2_30_33_46]PIR67381.1 MAG: 30S ribosomal protein S13 [bacterium CG10_big_fil_rev_8_21_14_0_10_33_18]PIU76769.1 MAG: 30S ribosomal protein S13 [bacterium CG06_land_8_20_14_3_00_33_50]PIW81286.1 MAG: 30S ribosomal protein S13 [bacterium CG_4_8_14_3_um_filter_33_28]PIY85725.1 MAG: 30S ribosomal protein S13 [bacterium CG_4_10_14_0_8_um_filter_33_57]PIZ86572.1 MAG: 30S ribosomal protein S13 [bacterium CG_4_10_14_0_2_um_filter_33_32]PJA72101.1 MAG: 30S